jgi:Holliday junction resolvase
VQKSILQWLKSLGPRRVCARRIALSGRVVTGGGRGTNSLKGFPDIVGAAAGGQLFAIEVKATRGRLSPEQERWLRLLEALGFVTLVARTLEDVQNLFYEKGLLDASLDKATVVSAFMESA